MTSRRIFKKTRLSKYFGELKREYERLKLAEKSFKHIKTPHPLKLESGALFMETMPGLDSSQFKHTLGPKKLVKEYIKITRLLWEENLETTTDLTPKWLINPNLSKKRNLHPHFANMSLQDLENILSKKPIIPKSDYVVVHGDLCPVNIMMNQSGKAYGLVDLGDLHMGDRLLDVAILSWTIRSNFGPTYEKMYLDGLDIDIDMSIIEYYRLIYDLSLPAYKNWSWIKYK